MIAIIAEKPSVGQDIARVIGATEKKDGYMAGNGYLVTWALGHLVSLAMPQAYGYGKASSEDLPMLPEPFQLVVRQIKTDRGMVTDIGAAKQLKVIDEVFSKCDSIIVATDAGREGELIFRYIYHYLGYTKPFKRLWISSLTDDFHRIYNYHSHLSKVLRSCDTPCWESNYPLYILSFSFQKYNQEPFS